MPSVTPLPDPGARRWSGYGERMQQERTLRRRRVTRWAGSAGIVALFVVAIWLDLATGLWQQAVIVSGIAAGLLTFLLTSLFFDHWTARADHQRWAPVTHLALTDLLHALADEGHSRLSHHEIVPRTVSALRSDATASLGAIASLRSTVTVALARWSGFLAASADVRPLMDQVAALALRMDTARDAVLAAVDRPDDPAAQGAMRLELAAVDRTVRTAIAEIETTLERLRVVD